MHNEELCVPHGQMLRTNTVIMNIKFIAPKQKIWDERGQLTQQCLVPQLPACHSMENRHNWRWRPNSTAKMPVEPATIIKGLLSWENIKLSTVKVNAIAGPKVLILRNLLGKVRKTLQAQKYTQTYLNDKWAPNTIIILCSLLSVPGDFVATSSSVEWPAKQIGVLNVHIFNPIRTNGWNLCGLLIAVQ